MDETLGEYLSVIRQLGENCNFGMMKDRLIRYRIVANIYDKKLQEKFLTENKLKRLSNKKRLTGIKYVLDCLVVIESQHSLAHLSNYNQSREDNCR